MVPLRSCAWTGVTSASSWRQAKGERYISKREALDEKHIAMALSNNHFALHAVRKEAREAEAREFARAQERAEDARLIIVGAKRWRAEQQALWDAASRIGKEPAEPWPHPDDIFINEAQRTWHWRGPLNEDGVDLFEWIRACRDEAFARAYLASRRNRKAQQKQTVWDIAWVAHESRLPLRWHILPKFDEVWSQYDRMTTRELECLIDDRAREASDRGRQLKVRRDKDTYRIVNGLMKPALARVGCRTLAQFEREQGVV